MKPNKAAKLGLGGSGSRRDVFERVRHGTVAVCSGPPVAAGQPLDLRSLTILGTGFVVDNRGIVLTAKHVIEPLFKSLQAMPPGLHSSADQLKIVTEGPRSFEGETVSMNWNVGQIVGVRIANEVDLAVLTFVADAQIRHSFEALALTSDPCHQGDEIAICGYPFGHQLHAEIYNNLPVVIPSFSAGIVSVVFPHPEAPPNFQTIFQMDAMINGGNSGGPIFKPGTGEVVGVVTQALNIRYRVLQDPAGPLEEKPGPNGPASGFFGVQQVPTGLSRGIHVHRAKQLIEDSLAAMK